MPDHLPRISHPYYSVSLIPRVKKPHLAVGLILLCLASLSAAFQFHSKLLDIVSERFGSGAADRLIEWQQLAETINASQPPHTEMQKLEQINDFFNQAKFVEDKDLWGEDDYWATPVELLARNAGDCEDYAIAKFYTLLAVGFDESKLQISYVKALELNQAHMVLAYYETPSSEPLILDNLKTEILPASQRPDLEPVYSFNGLGLWLNRFERENAKRLGGPEVMDQWNDMVRRQGIMLLRQQSTP